MREIRPVRRAPDLRMEHPVAKAAFVKTQQSWKVYWQRVDLRWHAYPPAPEVNSLEEFLAVRGAG